MIVRVLNNVMQFRVSIQEIRLLKKLLTVHLYIRVISWFTINKRQGY